MALITWANSLNCVNVRTIFAESKPFGLVSLYSRFMSSKKSRDCHPHPFPECLPENIAKTDCAQEENVKARERRRNNPFRDLMYKPECCVDPCREALPRFDALYYKISDKEKRDYQITWKQCEVQLRPRVSCFDKLGQVPYEKRPRNSKPKTASCEDDKNLLQCKSKRPTKCPNFTLPGCKSVRVPPSCLKTRGPKKCNKVCVPYPAFSECKRPKPKEKRKVECFCLELPLMCDVWAAVRDKKSKK